MDKQDFVVCFWMMFLWYLEGFCQKIKYQSIADTMRICKFLKSMKLLQIPYWYLRFWEVRKTEVCMEYIRFKNGI